MWFFLPQGRAGSSRPGLRPSSLIFGTVRGCLGPWHHLVTLGLITRHWGPLQVFLPPWRDSSAQWWENGHGKWTRGLQTPPGAAFPAQLKEGFILGRNFKLWGRLPASEGCQRTVLAPSTSRREEPLSPPPAQPPPTVLTVRDQGDVLGVGAQEVLHGAPQEQGLVHAVQLQGAVHPVHLQLRVVRGVGLQADLCRVVPQQPGGLPLGAAPGRGRIKAPKRQPDPCTTMGCNKLIDYFNKCEIIEVPVGFICPLTI